MTGTLELQALIQPQDASQEQPPPERQPAQRQGFIRQLVRFCIVGGLNTIVDLLILNALLWFWPAIDEYDAVIGYRANRQDAWIRKVNAWG